VRDQTRVRGEALETNELVMSIKILIVDDHPLVRQGLIGLLSTQPDFEVCGEASGLTEARLLASQQKPDVAIVDLSLEEGSGIELIKNLSEDYPDMKLLVLTMHDELIFAERALRAGAMGYVNKQEVSRTIVHAIREILEGKLYLSRRATERMVQLAVGSKGHHGQSPIERLTDREVEIFQMIGQGMTSRQIASKLGLSPKTVDAHRERIKQRLELHNVTELTKHAVQWVLENH
jgi:DNA-binding NarL/FixJ family response regulator